MEPLADVVRGCRQALELAPSGLLTDVDGTISPIAPTPDAAIVPPEIRESLGRLAAELDLVAAITGRATADARRLVGVAGLDYVGNHGLEELTPTGSRWDPAAEGYRPLLEAALAAVAGLPREIPGIIVEDKGPTVSVHYRLAANRRLARARIQELLQPFRDQLRITEGKMVVELRPPIDVSKATAVRRLVERRGLRGVVFLGDDRTDVGAFEALRELSASPNSSSPRTYGVAVASADTPVEVLRGADAVVAGVDDVAALLRTLADQLAGERR